MNFCTQSCKNCLISWKSAKNHRFGQNYETFSKKLPGVRVRVNPNPHYHVLTFRWTFLRKVAKTASFRKKARKLTDLAKTMEPFSTNYQCLVFRWTFQQKVAKSGSIREKARKIIDLAKTLQLFEQITMSLHFYQLFRRKFQKVPHSVKKHENSSISPNLCHFSNKLPCLCISMNFSEKSCKKFVISWKNTKNHRFGQTLQLFEETTMSWHFHELFIKKLQKVPHFVKKHDKSSISPKLPTSRKNYHVFTFRWTLWQKVVKTA